MRLSASLMGAAGGGAATGAAGEAPDVRAGVKAPRAGAGAGLEELATCAKAAGETAKAAKPIAAAANMAPTRRTPPASCAGQSGVNLHAKPTDAFVRLDRLNSEPFFRSHCIRQTPASSFHSVNPISTECNRFLSAYAGRHLAARVSSPMSAGRRSLLTVMHNFDPYYRFRYPGLYS